MTDRAIVDAADASPVRSSGFWQRLLRTPLLTKLVVLDVAINAGAFAVLRRAPPAYSEGVAVLSLVVMLILNVSLVAWALRPLEVLEDTAWRVSRGDFKARTSMPPLADRNIVRIGHTLDDLLERVWADRRRLRRLAAEVIHAADQERARVARELHDGTAQSLSALDMLLSSTLTEAPPGRITDRLVTMQGVVTEALDEVRALSRNVHPRVLDDLGLEAALEFLARRTREQSTVPVRVALDVAQPIPMPLASVLYRVAQEALHNAVKHASPREVRLELSSDPARAVLDVADDGIGFDVAGASAGEGDGRRGMGLFVMEERLALVDGQLEVTSGDGGTRVRAEVPLSRERGS